MIRTDHFIASFDSQTGRIDVRRSDGRPFLRGASACANTDAGKHSTAAPGRAHDVDTAAFRDALGTGRRLTVRSHDPAGRVDLSVDVAVYDHAPLVTVETHCTNVSTQDLRVTSLEPLRALPNEGGSLHVPNVTACLTNGEMYYDAGRLYTFASEPPPGLRPPIKGARLANASLAPTHPTVASWWNLALFTGYDREGVVLGYLESTRSLGVVLAARTAGNEIAFLAESVQQPAVTLPPGRSVGSNRFALHVAETPYTALERYAGAMGTLQNARTDSIVNGWCSWFYTLTDISEDEVLRNTAFAAAHLKPYGLEYIQLDEGYQRSHGDWEGNDRFPHGMRWLAERIHDHGLKAGLWVAPYVIAEDTDVFHRHPDWLVRRADGSLQRIGNWENESSPGALAEKVKRYCLDVTQTDAAAWLRRQFETFSRDWHYSLIKLDFMAWSILAAERYSDPSVSSADAYRRGLTLMRAGAGPDCHILECGPGNTTVGLIDSMRVEADINYGYAEAAWKQYFTDPSSSTAAAAKRYYFHRRTWVNDVDHACLALLPARQAEAAATSIALSGGNMISGDRLIDLDPLKLEILKKITPSSGEAAVPIDLFDADVPTAFVLRVERPFGGWWVAAFFNPDLENPVERRFPLTRLGLDPAQRYLAFDFWQQRFAGELPHDELCVTVPAGGVTLLALHAATGKPQLLSTSRHVAQGAIEIAALEWVESEQALRGVSIGPPGSAHDVFIYVPGHHPWTWQNPAPFRDRGEYSVKLVDANVARVHVRFDGTSRVPWKMGLDDLAADSPS